MRVRGRALIRLKMIDELRTINREAYQDIFVFPTDDKTKQSLFTDKQAFQEMKTTGGIAKQLKRAVSFTPRSIYSC